MRVFLDVLIMLAKHKRVVTGGLLAAFVFFLLVSVGTKPRFMAETRFLVQTTSFGLKSGPQELASLAMINKRRIARVQRARGMINNARFVEVLKSRPLLERMLERFPPGKDDKIRKPEQALRRMRGKLKVKLDEKTGLICLSMIDRDPRRSAAMANAFVEELRSRYQSIVENANAGQLRFLEEKIREARESLTKAEDAMKDFQEKTGAVAINEQTTLLVKQIAQIGYQIAVKEVDLKVMAEYSQPQNPEMRLAREELAGLREQMQALKTAYSPDNELNSGTPIPAVYVEHRRLQREVAYNENLYESLTSQYQLAKLNEDYEDITIRVIEKAVPPEKPIRPNYLRRAVKAVFVGIFFAALMAAVSGWSRSRLKPSQAD